MKIQYDLPTPIKCKVSEEFLTTGYSKLSLTPITLLDAEIVGINSYKNEALTFTLNINGALYDYVPPTMITTGKHINTSYTLKDLVYNNNQSSIFTVIHSPYISNKCKAFFPRKKDWANISTVICTIDWYTSNDKRHIVILENGMIAAVPNHKINLNGIEQLPSGFSKIRETFKV